MIKPSNRGVFFPPNRYHKCKMIPHDLSGTRQRNFIDAIECPMHDALVYPLECQECEHGKAGDYKEKWVKCDFPEILAKEEFEVLKDVVNGVHVDDDKVRKEDIDFGNWVDI